MAGEAKTSAFMIGEATVMIGPPEKLWDLNPTDHSIGLVKNFTMTAEPRYTELTQGVKNTIVYSVLTQNPVRASMEVYEYTGKNMAYGLGLDGSTISLAGAGVPLKAALTGNDGTPVTTATFDSVTDVTGAWLAGAWIAIQENGSDDVHVAKLSANSTKTGSGPYVITLTFAGQGLKTGRNFTTAAKIYLVSKVDVGSKAEQPFLAAKVVCILPEENRPSTLLIPKLRITKGFNLAYTSQNFGNLPFEFTPYELVSTDSFYSEFKDAGVARLLHGR